MRISTTFKRIGGSTTTAIAAETSFSAFGGLVTIDESGRQHPALVGFHPPDVLFAVGRVAAFALVKTPR
jgi:hypothetical protein